MTYRLGVATGSMMVALLLFGCSNAGDSSDNIVADRVPASFERVNIAGVTSDHASTGGVSWVDYDGDDDLDLFVSNGYDVSTEVPDGQPNHLYRNDRGGGFLEITTGALATSKGISSGHTWGDYDNDGDLDVFIANQQDQNNALFRNEGDGTFVSVENEPQVTDGGHSYAAAWVDVDNDGWLDLFVSNGGMSHVGRNGLYRGTGNGHFEKVTEGDIVTDEAATCGIAWGDYDNDGDLDLFLANTGFAPPTNNNVLYRNDGGWTLTRVEDVPVVIDGLPSCAATWVDVDNDLDLDLHVTSMYGLANLLYLNDGRGSLSIVKGSPLTLDGGHSYGANWEDYDNDGDMDVMIANWGSGPDVYLNDGQGHFDKLRSGDLGGRIEFAGAIASGDFDTDGDIDVYVGNWPNTPGSDELNSLYRNRGGGGHWLRIRLIGTNSNRSAIGARVLLTSHRGAETVTQMREVTTQMGFRGQSDLSPQFGLGRADGALSLEVRWPSGRISTMDDVAIDRVLHVTEPVSASD
ncbi:MAG: CRTAC1 family protein [Candidatus Krumholzibacteria bacterium]|nr:CRTAC1 family protein [Candidatus Krumholzibacteria bacterium]